MRYGAYGAGIFTGDKLRAIVSAANVVMTAKVVVFILIP